MSALLIFLSVFVALHSIFISHLSSRGERQQKQILLLSDTLVKVSEMVRDRRLKEFEGKLQSILMGEGKDDEVKS